MPDEQTMRDAMQAYIDAFNRKDLAAIVALYADDATVEDPVGSPVKSGRAEIEAFYEGALKMGATLNLVAPIRASHGDSAAMAFDVDVTLPDGPVLIHVIDVMTFNEAGQYTSMRAFWGAGDMVSLS